MIYYLLVVGLLFLIGFLFQDGNKKRMLKTGSFILAFFSGFRYEVGVDYPNYVNIFDGLIGYSTREIGFQFLIYSLNYIGSTPQLMFLLLALLFQYFTYKVIEYYSVNYWISLLIFFLIPPFFLASFNGVRQYIAIVVFLYSLRFLESKSYFKYILCGVVGALFFHQTIIFVMFLFPFLMRKLSKKIMLLLFIIMIIINFGLSFLLNLTSYANYLDVESDVEVSLITYLLFFISVLIVIFGNYSNDFKYKNLLLNLNYFSFLSLAIVMLQSNEMMIQMFMRLNNYFFFGFIILVPNLIFSIKDNSTKFVGSFLVIGVSLLYFLFTIINKGLEYNLTPYEFNFKLF